MRDSSNLTKYVETGRVTVASFGSTFIYYSFVENRIDDMEALRVASELHVARHPEGFAWIAVVPENGLGAVDDEVRREAVRLTKLFEPNLRAQAFVLLGNGFKLATTRLIISTIRLLSTSTVPQKTFAALAPATRWLGDHDARIDDRALLGAVDGLMAQTRSEAPLGPATSTRKTGREPIQRRLR